MFKHELEESIYDPALFGLPDGFCFEFDELDGEIAASADVFAKPPIKPISPWAAALERLLVKIIAIGERKCNCVSISRGRVSLKLRQTKDDRTLERGTSCHDSEKK